MKWSLAVAMLLLSACATIPTPEQISHAEYGQLSPAYKEHIQAHMFPLFYDPESARYRYLGEPTRGYAYINGDFQAPQFGYLVNVRINAKNRMGGYAGEKPFTFLVRNESVWRLGDWTTREIVKRPPLP